jgi:death-on-curing protein
LFLRLNGYRLVADQAQATLIILSVASGALSEDDLATWIRRHLKLT